MEEQDVKLSAVEVSVLSTLIEKSKVTPEYYPMTINALTAACNQKTSRNPVTAYTEQEVTQAIGVLKGKSLVATAVGGTSRSVKYKHNFGTVYDLSDAAIVIICLLMLRGPQTAGELNTNSGRMYEFRDLSEVLQVLDKLTAAEQAFVEELPRLPGQKENRFRHTFGEISPVMDVPSVQEPLASATISIEERLQALEEEVAMLRNLLKDLL